MAVRDSTGSTSKTKKGVKLENPGADKGRREQAPCRIQVSHFFGWKSYCGSKEDLISAGLVEADQCPTVAGDDGTIGFVLGGRDAQCSLSSSSEGTKYWVSIDDPQPREGIAVLKALGDKCAIDEVELTGRCYLALRDYVEQYASHQTAAITNEVVLELFLDRIAPALERAQNLFRSNSTFQREVANALSAIERLYVASGSIEEADSINSRDLLCLYVHRIGAAMKRAGDAVDSDFSLWSAGATSETHADEEEAAEVQP